MGDAPAVAEGVEYGRLCGPWPLGGTPGLGGLERMEKQQQQWQNSREQTGSEKELQ